MHACMQGVSRRLGVVSSSLKTRLTPSPGLKLSRLLATPPGWHGHTGEGDGRDSGDMIRAAPDMSPEPLASAGEDAAAPRSLRGLAVKMADGTSFTYARLAALLRQGLATGAAQGSGGSLTQPSFSSSSLTGKKGLRGAMKGGAGAAGAARRRSSSLPLAAPGSRGASLTVTGRHPSLATRTGSAAAVGGGGGSGSLSLAVLAAANASNASSGGGRRVGFTEAVPPGSPASHQHQHTHHSGDESEHSGHHQQQQQGSGSDSETLGSPHSGPLGSPLGRAPAVAGGAVAWLGSVTGRLGWEGPPAHAKQGVKATGLSTPSKLSRGVRKVTAPFRRWVRNFRLGGAYIDEGGCACGLSGCLHARFLDCMLHALRLGILCAFEWLLQMLLLLLPVRKPPAICSHVLCSLLIPSPVFM